MNIQRPTDQNGISNCSIIISMRTLRALVSRAVPFSRWFIYTLTRWIINAQVHFRACQFTRWFVYARWSIYALIHVRTGPLTRCVIHALLY
jgi:hypothetical protein